METVKKRPTLRRVLAGYLVLTGGLCLLAAAVWWGSFAALVRAGVIWPADRMSELAYEAKTAVEAAGTLPPEALPERCGYLLLDGAGEVLSTNLTGRRLEAALERSPRGGLWSPYRLRLLEARQTDGTVYLFQYDYAVHYADPVLDGALPDFQTCWLLLGAGAAVLIIGWTTRRTGRLLTADAQLLSQAAAQVASRELEGAPFGGARVREYEQALATMQTLREELAASLSAQWEADRRRDELLSALTHEHPPPGRRDAAHRRPPARHDPEAQMTQAEINRRPSTMPRRNGGFCAVRQNGPGPVAFAPALWYTENGKGWFLWAPG